MLPDLLKILKALCLALHDGGHSAEGSPLELLAPVQRVSVLEETHIVLGDIVDEVESDVDLTEGQLVVVLVIEDVHKISIERVDVIQLGEVCQDLGKLVVEALLGELDFSHVKLADARNLVLLVHDGRCFPLRFGQDDVDKVLGWTR